jgi:hypothetical protein
MSNNMSAGTTAAEAARMAVGKVKMTAATLVAAKMLISAK